nr:MAG TPA: tail completion protein [Caudoviricetes sp.]
MKATPSPLGKDRFLLKSPFDVHFFPEDEKDNAVMQAIAWQLWQALEFITLPGGDKLHGTSMSWEVQDDVLHFFVSFNMTLRRIDLPEKMGELHMEVNQ